MLDCGGHPQSASSPIDPRRWRVSKGQDPAWVGGRGPATMTSPKFMIDMRIQGQQFQHDPEGFLDPKSGVSAAMASTQTRATRQPPRMHRPLALCTLEVPNLCGSRKQTECLGRVQNNKRSLGARSRMQVLEQISISKGVLEQ